ncbi:hypothetical protein Sjap_007384 [Stephania japonica]|uniref:Protein EXORDIUM-like 2 n=1 Tax=Stephania japonica TaxID=461633 RepID=A0AAP0JNE2_9MAGN
MRSLLLPFTLISALVLFPTCSCTMMNNNGPNHNSSLAIATTSSLVTYHKGPLLAGPKSINVYLIWYGLFSPMQKSTITSFLASFNPISHQTPSVSTWWMTTQAYRDLGGRGVSSTVRLAGQASDIKSSLGKTLKRADIAVLVRRAISSKVFGVDQNGVYLVLTSQDVTVERFCMGSCGFHDNLAVSTRVRVVYAHVGDPATQCPSLCAWPFAAPAYGPPGQPVLRAPNGIGTDGMVMNIATILAGAATNPFKNGYFQGDPLAPLEAVTACPGVFGAGAYPGYPGKLFVSATSKASFNAYGAGGKVFLLPAIWDLVSMSCKSLT